MAASPERASALLARARVLASEDRHEEAIQSYLAAFAADTSLVGLHAHELGHQYNWNDQPAQAVPWFEKRLERAPGNVEARMGYARALSWADRTYQGWQEWRRVLVGHPGILEARLGEAQTRNWLGRHRQAARRYEAILDDHPDNHAARLGLAQAWSWAGESRRALAALDPLRGDAEAEALRQRILAEQGSRFLLTTGLSDDSDEIRILTTTAAWERSSPRFQDLRLALARRVWRQDGQPDVDAWSLTAGGGLRPSVGTEVHAYLTGHSFASDGPIGGGPPSPVDFDLLGYDAWFTWFPHARWRVDLSSDRGYMDTPRSLSEEIAVTSGAASCDWRIRNNLAWSLLGRYSGYSDGNGRRSAATSLAYSRGRRWRITLRPSATVFAFEKASDKGYWNPEDFLNLGGALLLEGELDERLVLYLEGNLGHEWADEEDYGVAGFGVRLRWRLRPRLYLEGAGGSSDSRLTSDGGYTRSWAWLGLRLDL